MKTKKIHFPIVPPTKTSGKIQVPPHLPAMHGIHIWVGRRNAGKSVAATNLIKRYLDIGVVERASSPARRPPRRRHTTCFTPSSTSTTWSKMASFPTQPTASGRARRRSARRCLKGTRNGCSGARSRAAISETCSENSERFISAGPDAVLHLSLRPTRLMRLELVGW